MVVVKITEPVEPSSGVNVFATVHENDFSKGNLFSFHRITILSRLPSLQQRITYIYTISKLMALRSSSQVFICVCVCVRFDKNIQRQPPRVR